MTRRTTLIPVLSAALLAAAGLLPSAASAAEAPPAPLTLYLVSEHSAPAAMRDGNDVTGRETDKIREMMQRTGTSYKLDLLPWKRAYTVVQERPDMCVYSMSRTPEREALFKWVGPTDEADWVLYGRADSGMRLRTLEDARPLRIGTYVGDARDTYLRTRGFHVDATQNDLANPEKLMKNRIDLWAVGIRSGSNVMKQFPWSDQIEPLLVFNHIKVYLACNLAVPDSVITQLNGAMAAMRRDGGIKKIEQKWENWSAPK
jgi:polar amino acid transport system substrate-binding protein